MTEEAKKEAAPEEATTEAPKVRQKLTLAERLAAAEEKVKQLKERKKRAEALEKTKASKAARTADTRRKILLGAWLLSVVESQKIEVADLQIGGRRFMDFLTEDRDKDLFTQSGQKEGA